MSKAGRLLDKYWVLYYVVYAGLSVFHLIQLWNRLPQESRSDRVVAFFGTTGALSDAFGTSAGIAVLFLVFVEGIGRMALLIPATIKRIKREGKREGKREERRASRQRMKEALERFGVEQDGVKHLPMTPEVQAFLNVVSDPD